ncbi:MAG TPA: FdhF/YdeP family oxidoreductase [Fimbriimonadaceae bacterium]|nr:FdhF/YdeP family oxidoreductase [Fimbriimonadaceae bacterium]
MKTPRSGGGWQAIRYTLRKGREVGFLRLWRAMRSRNACKTCALGMGGQNGGMVNESGHFPEVCKKSLQAMTADMRGRIDPKFFETYTIEQLQSLSPRELEMAGRIVDPVLLEPGAKHFRVLSWDEATAKIVQEMRDSEPDRAFFYASGRTSNEAGFLLHLFARAYGTNHVSNCSYYCHQASGYGLRESVGVPTATISLEDVEKCDVLFLIGGNPASNHPRFMAQLVNLRARGGNVIVVNPVKETGLVAFKVPSNMKSMVFGSEVASQYVQPSIGGDIAFLIGVAKALLERGAIDHAFLNEHTEGATAVLDQLGRSSWTEIESASGLSQREMEESAEVYARSERAIFAWTMGITHHTHGVENVQWIANLALLRGMVGKPGAGLLPIRGHSNVQGMGSVGVYPRLSQMAIEKLTGLGVEAPKFEGLDTLAALEAAHEGKFDVGLCLGGNLFGASPDARFVEEAFSKIRTVVYLSTTLNTGHAHGLGQSTIILPVKARDEESQLTTQESMFSFVRVSDGGAERFKGPRSEVDVLIDVAKETLTEGPLEWTRFRNHDEIRNLIADLYPALGPIARVGQTRREFEIPGRVLHEPAFPTPNRKARLHAHPIPERHPLKPDQLNLMTVRSEGQFNTIVYEEEDIYRGQERRDVILLNPEDMVRLQLSNDDLVQIENEWGTMRVLARSFDIAKNCALMYYPEANVLIPRRADPKSRTPAFKSTIVRVRKLEGGNLVKPLATGKQVDRKEMPAC